MSEPSATTGDSGAALLALYDAALPHVYGYLLARCDGTAVAEDLTAETFLAAVDAARRDDPPAMSIPWVIGVARHKLVDHWRRKAREERRLRAVVEGPWRGRRRCLTPSRRSAPPSSRPTPTRRSH